MLGQAERSAQASATGADDHGIVLVVPDRVAAARLQRSAAHAAITLWTTHGGAALTDCLELIGLSEITARAGAELWKERREATPRNARCAVQC